MVFVVQLFNVICFVSMQELKYHRAYVNVRIADVPCINCKQLLDNLPNNLFVPLVEYLNFSRTSFGNHIHS